MFEKQLKRLIYLITTLWLCGSTCLFAQSSRVDGGRVGTGGPASMPIGCMTPDELSKRLELYRQSESMVQYPEISLEDPTITESLADASCAIPAGELVLSHRDMTPPNIRKAWGELLKCPDGYVRPNSGFRQEAHRMQHKITPTKDCKHIVEWSFYRSKENQLKYQKPPESCLESSPGTLRSVDETIEGFFDQIISCEKIPFFSTKELAYAARAKAPFAYLEQGEIVVDRGRLYFTSSKYRLDKKAVSGKVYGTSESFISNYPYSLNIWGLDNYGYNSDIFIDLSGPERVPTSSEAINFFGGIYKGPVDLTWPLLPGAEPAADLTWPSPSRKNAR